jgi:nitrite reductase/ring-hydroxylating ferredoxin subunit/Fe-S cluster biogenesis protein NfuA
MATAEHRPAELSARVVLAGLVDRVAQLEQAIHGWDDQARGAVAAYKRAIDELHAEALRRLVRAFKAEPAAIAALRAAVTDEVVYSVFRQLQIVKPSLDERVEVALTGVRPLLALHGGDVELVRVAPPMIEVRLLGACDGCASSMMTFHAGVKQAVLAGCPEITEVHHIQGSGAARGEVTGEPFASPFAVSSFGTWHYACHLGELDDGEALAVAIGGRNLLLARHAGAVSCIANACAHLGLSLDDGEVSDGVLTCPHHGFQYDLTSGACLTAPTMALTTYPARIVGTRIEVKLAR